MNVLYKAASGQGVSEIAVVKFGNGCRIYTRIGASRRDMPRPGTHFEIDRVLAEARAWIAGRNFCEAYGSPWANQFDGGAAHPADAFAQYGHEPRKPYAKPAVEEHEYKHIVTLECRTNPYM